MWAVFAPVLSRYVRPVLPIVVLAIFAGIVGASAGFLLPLLLQKAFPIVFGQAPPPEWLADWLHSTFPASNTADLLLWAAALSIPAAMVLRGVGTYFNTYLLTLAGMKMLNRMRVELFAHLQWISFSYLDQNRRGDLMTKVMQYTQQVQMQMSIVLNDLVIQPLTLAAATAYLIYAAVSSEESAMLLGNLLIAALFIPLVRLVGKRVVRQMRKMLTSFSLITQTVEETLSSQREVRAFNLEERQENRLRAIIRKLNGQLMRIAAWQQGLSPAIEVVSSAALAFALYQGSRDHLTLEQFTAIAVAFYYCYDPLKRLGAVLNQCQLLSVAVEAVMSVFKAYDSTPEPEHPLSLPEGAPGRVDFEHVSFSYDGETPVLRDVTVHVPAGQVVALVGPSGSGKTTFINLICRFYDVQEGSVLMDGVDVRRLTREERTRHIGLVSQFSSLFRATIRENIRVGRRGATDAEVETAAHEACVDGIVREKPEGFEFMLAEGGGGLSGGQKQRVSIARAFLKNAPVLILDEATSALDMRSEATIQQSLERLARGHTTFVIAHRFSTIRMAQRILVFDQGRIVADGSHNELYTNCVLYRHLYDEQVRNAGASCAASPEGCGASGAHAPTSGDAEADGEVKGSNQQKEVSE